VQVARDAAVVLIQMGQHPLHHAHVGWDCLLAHLPLVEVHAFLLVILLLYPQMNIKGSAKHYPKPLKILAISSNCTAAQSLQQLGKLKPGTYSSHLP
jgi:hypothetical protein